MRLDDHSVSPTHSRHCGKSLRDGRSETLGTRLFKRAGMALVEGITAVSLLVVPYSALAQGKATESTETTKESRAADATLAFESLMGSDIPFIE